MDANYVEDLDRRRSLIRHMFPYNNCTINWKAQLQNVVAVLITEVEYTTVAEAIKEVIWLNEMLKKLGVY